MTGCERHPVCGCEFHDVGRRATSVTRTLNRLHRTERRHPHLDAVGFFQHVEHPSEGAIRIADYANILDGEKIVIGNKTYEWDDDASVGAGNVLVTIGASVNIEWGSIISYTSIDPGGRTHPR